MRAGLSATDSKREKPVITESVHRTAFYALSFAGLLWWNPKEEYMTIEALDDEYKAYMQCTCRFSPKF